MAEVTSLADKRAQKQKLISNQFHTVEERLLDLEKDQLRMIDLLMDLEQRMDLQEKFLRKLLHLLKESK